MFLHCRRPFNKSITISKERFSQNTVTLHFRVSLGELLDKMKDAEPSFVRYVGQHVNVTFTLSRRMCWKDSGIFFSSSFVYIARYVFSYIYRSPLSRRLDYSTFFHTHFVYLLYLYCCHLRSWHRQTQMRTKKKRWSRFLCVCVFISPFDDEKKERYRRKTNGKY